MVIEAKGNGGIDEGDYRVFGRRGDLMDILLVEEIIKRAKAKKADFTFETKKRELTEDQFKEILETHFPDSLDSRTVFEMKRCGIIKYITQEPVCWRKEKYDNLVLFYMESLKHRIETRQVTYLDEMTPQCAHDKLRRDVPELLKKFEDAGAVVVLPAGKNRRKIPMYEVDVAIREALLYAIYHNEERNEKDVLEDIIECHDFDVEDDKLQAFAELTVEGSTFYDYIKTIREGIRSSMLSAVLYKLVAHLAADMYLKRRTLNPTQGPLTIEERYGKKEKI